MQLWIIWLLLFWISGTSSSNTNLQCLADWADRRRHNDVKLLKFRCNLPVTNLTFSCFHFPIVVRYTSEHHLNWFHFWYCWEAKSKEVIKYIGIFCNSWKGHWWQHYSNKNMPRIIRIKGDFDKINGPPKNLSWANRTSKRKRQNVQSGMKVILPLSPIHFIHTYVSTKKNKTKQKKQGKEKFCNSKSLNGNLKWVQCVWVHYIIK